jgi:hypothetical protein
MPIKEIIAIAAMVMAGIVITHPFSYGKYIRQAEFSILREATRTDNWGDPSLYHHNRYMKPRGKIYPHSRRNISTGKIPSGT